MFPWLFHSHKMGLSALLGPFTDRNDRFPYPFIYFNYEIPTCSLSSISCTWSLTERYPFRAEPPRKGRYREYPGFGQKKIWEGREGERRKGDLVRPIPPPPPPPTLPFHLDLKAYCHLWKNFIIWLWRMCLNRFSSLGGLALMQKTRRKHTISDTKTPILIYAQALINQKRIFFEFLRSLFSFLGSLI